MVSGIFEVAGKKSASGSFGSRTRRGSKKAQRIEEKRYVERNNIARYVSSSRA